MILNTIETGDFFIIEVDGDLDAVSAIDLDGNIEKVVMSGAKQILVDCHKLAYISSPGIGVFTSRLSDAQDGGAKIVLYGLNEKIKDVFSVLGLDAILPIFTTLEEAKNYIANGV